MIEITQPPFFHVFGISDPISLIALLIQILA